MAKRLLLSILVDVLGKYVEGLTVENLKVGVWSGKIELNNLELKRTALDGLNLPITISHGILKHLKLIIPWTALESKPVKVIIDGLYLQAGPLNLSKLDVEEIKKSILANKRLKLQQAEDLIISKGSTSTDNKETTESSSYIQRLTMKIIDNLEVTLTNIHIRYEDPGISIPNKCFSLGITIAAIKLSTIDDNGNEAFVVRSTAPKSADIIHKLGKMENLGIYWNSNELNPLDHLSSIDWKIAMHNLIYSGDGTTSDGMMSQIWNGEVPTNKVPLPELDYILIPPNLLTVRIDHRQKSTVDVPKIDVNIQSSLMPFDFDRMQYKQILDLITAFTLLEQHKMMAIHRPSKRPNIDPKAWWKYAYKLVMAKDLSVQNKVTLIIMLNYFSIYFLN